MNRNWSARISRNARTALFTAPLLCKHLRIRT